MSWWRTANTPLSLMVAKGVTVTCDSATKDHACHFRLRCGLFLTVASSWTLSTFPTTNDMSSFLQGLRLA